MDTEVFVFDIKFCELILDLEIKSKIMLYMTYSKIGYIGMFLDYFYIFSHSYGQRENRREEVEAPLCRKEN